MKRHSYLTSVPLTDDQLLISSTNAWVSYAENKQKRNSVSSPYVQWKCFNCSKLIKVHYQTTNCKSLYCPDCRPKRLKKTGVHIRYLMMFKNHVRALILKHTSLSNLLDDVTTSVYNSSK